MVMLKIKATDFQNPTTLLVYQVCGEEGVYMHTHTQYIYTQSAQL